MNTGNHNAAAGASACPEFDQLKAFVDGEAAEADAHHVALHLNGCAQCAREVRIMKQIGSELEGMESAVEPPPGLRAATLARLRFRPEAGRMPSPFFLLRWAAAMVTAVVAVFIALNLAPPITKSRGGDDSRTARPRMLAQQMKMHTQDYDETARTAPAPPAGAAAPGGPMAGGTGGMAGGMAAPGGGYPEVRYSRNPFRSNSEMREVMPGATSAYSDGSVKSVTPDDVRRYTHGKALDEVKRKVVQNASLSVQVNRGLESVQAEISKRLVKEGGYVEDASLAAPEKGDRTLSMTLRVPVEQFEDTVSYLSALGEVKAKSSAGQDVTGTWIDERAEVRELRKEEQRLVNVYEKAKKAWQREEARQQLLGLRPRIAAAEERFALTGKLAALATIRLTLIEEPQARIRGSLLHDLDNTTRAALAAFMVALRVPAAVLIWVIVFSPLWLPCVLVYRWATRMAQRTQPPAHT